MAKIETMRMDEKRIVLIERNLFCFVVVVVFFINETKLAFTF